MHFHSIGTFAFVAQNVCECPATWILARFGLKFNPLERRGNYSATSNNIKWNWPLTGGLLHLVQREGGGTARGHSLPRPLLAVPNVTAHPSTASVPITVLLHNEWSIALQFSYAHKGLMTSSVGHYNNSCFATNLLSTKYTKL